MKVTKKEYYCPVCGKTEMVSTNHYGEIYSGCKSCGNSVLYCAEGEGKGKPDGKCKIVFYHFNLDNEFEREQYKQLRNNLSNKGYRKFDTYEKYQSYKAFKEHDGREVNVYKKDQFDNQYVSDIGRIFDWYEYIWDNKNVIDGYYLEW